MALLGFFVLFLALSTGQSSALYCLSKDGVGDDQLQKALDYACGFGADCGPIQPSGPCYKPNTVKDHCNYAVNSYYQNMQSAGGTCDFAGAAKTSPTPPSTPSGCVYPSGPSDSGAGTTPPSIGTTPGTSPSTPIAPSTGKTPGTASGTPPFTPKPPSTGTTQGTTPDSPNVFGTSPPFTNGSSNIKGMNTKLLLLLVLAITWLALRA